MDATLKKIKKLTLFMKKEGLTYIKSGDIELKLDLKFIEPPAQTHEQETTDKIEVDKFTDDEILYWSSPGLTPEKDATQHG